MKIKFFISLSFFSFVVANENQDFQAKERLVGRFSPCNCVQLGGQALLECMNELEDKQYKKNLKNLNYRKFQRLEYFKNLLKTPENYEVLFKKYTEEEWQEFWKKLPTEEQKLFPKTREGQEKFIKQMKDENWWNEAYWYAGIGTAVVLSGGTAFYCFGPYAIAGSVGKGVAAGITAGAVAGGVGKLAKDHCDQKRQNNKNLKTAKNL